MLALVDQVLPFRFRFIIIAEEYYFFGRIDLLFEPLPNETVDYSGEHGLGKGDLLPFPPKLIGS
jgi:hypothetical protein